MQINAHLRRQIVSAVVSGASPIQAARNRGVAQRYVIDLLARVSRATPRAVANPITREQLAPKFNAWLSSAESRLPTSAEEYARARLGQTTYNAISAMMGSTADWTLYQLAKHTEAEVRRQPGIGNKAMREITEALNSIGLTLASKPKAIEAAGGIAKATSPTTHKKLASAIAELKELMASDDLPIDALAAIKSASEMLMVAQELSKPASPKRAA